MNDINQHYDEYDVQYSNQDNQEIPLIDLVENKVHFVGINLSKLNCLSFSHEFAASRLDFGWNQCDPIFT